LINQQGQFLNKSLKTWMVVAALATVTGVISIGLFAVKRALDGLPNVESLEQYVPPLVTNVVDINDRPVGEFFTERRTTVPLTKIPVDLRQALISTEDTEFYQHWGVNPTAIVRAMLANVRAGATVQGGSTLTQQLAKTIYLSREKTLVRKFKELLLTLQIERRYSKDEILQLYMNQVYFGGGAYGVEAAAQLYFDKHAQDLNLSECALLAGLVRSPNRYSPIKNPELARLRRAHVLKRMRTMNVISDEELKQADAVPVATGKSLGRVKDAPYFIEEIRKMLEPVYGAEMLEQGGLTIHTTLDVRMQKAAEAVLEEHLAAYDAKFSTATLIEYRKDLTENTTNEIRLSTTAPKIQGALVAMDVHTGAIRAYVGGRNFGVSQFNRVTQAKRQPGSSFKPFTYASALEANFTASTIVEDSPLVFIDMESDPTLLAETTTYAETMTAILDNLQMTAAQFAALKKEEKKEKMARYWRPQNFDAKYLGPMTLRTALQRSRNLVSIRIIDSIGPRNVVRFAHAAGVESHLSPYLSLALGTSVVDLLELTNAYGTLASGGIRAEPYYVERVLDRRGKIMEEHSPKLESRLSPQTCFLITNILQGVINHGTGWYAKRLGRPLAGKTGTTQDQRDLLFIAFSPDLVCGVWVGYDDFRPLKKGLSASNIAVPLWTDFMREALKSYPAKEFPIPPKIEFAKVDAVTGFLALPTCPRVILEAFKDGTVPVEFCPYDHSNEPETDAPAQE
jgi:penicillin-binding protein 1A